MVRVLPPGYKASLHLRLDDVPWLGLMLGSGAIFAAGLGLFITAIAASRPHQLPLWWIFIFTISFFAVFVPHEGIHAICFMLLGAKPRFGTFYRFKYQILGLYTTTTPGYFFTRYEFALIALAPLFMLTVAGLVAIWLQPTLLPWLGFPLVGNASASVGDLWGALRVLQQPRDVLIEDRQEGLIFYLPTHR